MVFKSSTAIVHSWFRMLDSRKRSSHRQVIAEIARLERLIDSLSSSLCNLELNWNIYGRATRESSNYMFQEFYQVLRALRTRKEQLERLLSLEDRAQLQRAVRLRARPIRVSAPGTRDPLPICHYEIEADHVENFTEMVLAAVSTELQGIKVSTATHRPRGETLGTPAGREMSWA